MNDTSESVWERHMEDTQAVELDDVERDERMTAIEDSDRYPANFTA